MSHRIVTVVAALRRLGNSWQINNVIAAIRSIYGCQVQVYNLQRYELSMQTMTREERAEIIEWVLVNYVNYHRASKEMVATR